MADRGWAIQQAAREAALARGEELARDLGFQGGSVDPFVVVQSEGNRIHIEGDDFQDAFDGRLSYHGNRFLLIYNNCYNMWPHMGAHHPKVRFTIAHELGHYFLERHRKILVTQRMPIESRTEFESEQEWERQADAFATGLLLPKYLVAPCVNTELDASIASIKDAAARFDVSLTSMLVRWTQLSHFPCATLCVREGVIQWGFVSEAFRRCGLWRARRLAAIRGASAKRFYVSDPSCLAFREGQGTGRASDWMEGDCPVIDVRESYLVMPYCRSMLTFVCADEDDLPTGWDDE